LAADLVSTTRHPPTVVATNEQSRLVLVGWTNRVPVRDHDVSASVTIVLA
jgi:hypothetical protein